MFWQKSFEKNKTDDIMPPADVKLEDYPAGDFDSFFLLTFHSFKMDSIIARPVGGMAVNPVQLGDEDEVANPAWDLIWSNNRKEQRQFDKQLAHRGGRKGF